MARSDDAYEAARRLIAEVKGTRAKQLSFDHNEYRALETLPPEVSELDWLNGLWLKSTQVNDLSPIAGIAGLKMLRLDNTQVADLAPVAGLTALVGLWLINTQVVDLTPISGLTRLKILRLDSTHVADITPIAKLTALKSLRLHNTQVVDLTPVSGLTALRTLHLDNTQVADLLPIAGLTALTSLRLQNTRVVDLTPIDGLKALKLLSLGKTQVIDLRPIRKLQTWAENPFAVNLFFSDIPATRRDQRIAEIAGIEGNEQRARELFEYLENWQPPEEVGDNAPRQDRLLPVDLVDGRLEIAASHPDEAERDEALKRALHERLRPKAAELAQAAGNIHPRIAARARSLVAQVDRPFEELDMLLIHLDVEDLAGIYASRDQRRDEQALSVELVDALADVGGIGPGLTLDNEVVELLEDRKRRFAEAPPGPEVQAAHDALTRAVAADEAAIGDRLRALEERNKERSDQDSTGAIQVAMHRNIFVRIGRLALDSGGTIALGAAGSALWFLLQTNSDIILPLLSSYGTGFAQWFKAAVSGIEELAGLFANVEKKPLQRRGNTDKKRRS